jgi:hypothetical protein
MLNSDGSYQRVDSGGACAQQALMRISHAGGLTG